MTAAMIALALAGCDGGSSSEAPGPHAAPTHAALCDDQPATGAEGGVQIGTDWSGEHHEYGDTVVVYGCLPSAAGSGNLSLVPDGRGIRVRPGSAAPEPSTGLATFHVTVSAGATGPIRLRWREDGRSRADVPGPVVSTDGAGWHFVAHPG